MAVPKIVQVDKRGQIVIPKDVRTELNISSKTNLWVYSITDEGILLKKIKPKELLVDDPVIAELKEKSVKINLDPKNIDKSVSGHLNFCDEPRINRNIRNDLLSDIPGVFFKRFRKHHGDVAR